MSAAGFEYVTLSVDGYVIIGWQEVSIDRSMQSGAISFQLQATNPSWSAAAMSLRRGKNVEIRAALDLGTARGGGGDLMCRGAVDEYDADVGEEANKVVTLDGRSKGRDAIDCPPVKHNTGRVENKNLLQVAQELDEFGVNWTTDQQLPVIPMVQRQPHEPHFDTIEREARKSGHMLAAQPDGGIKITRAGQKRHAGVLVAGQSPVRKYKVHLAPHEKRSPTVVRGQKRLGHGKDNLRQEYQDTGDSDVGHRPALVLAEGDYSNDDLKKRAQWDRLRRAGRALTVTMTVSRWRDDAGALWDPGRIMAIQVADEDVDQDLLLSTAKFHQDLKGGTTAVLTFVDPKAHGGQASAGSSDQAFDPGSAIS